MCGDYRWVTATRIYCRESNLGSEKKSGDLEEEVPRLSPKNKQKTDKKNLASEIFRKPTKVNIHFAYLLAMSLLIHGLACYELYSYFHDLKLP